MVDIEIVGCWFDEICGGDEYVWVIVVQCDKFVDFECMLFVCVLCMMCENGQLFFVFVFVQSEVYVVYFCVYLLLVEMLCIEQVFVVKLLVEQVEFEVKEVGLFDVFVVVYCVYMLNCFSV